MAGDAAAAARPGRWLALAPAVLLATIVCSGGLWSGASTPGALVTTAALMLVLGLSGGLLLRPFGARSGWVSGALAVALIVSAALSPTPRAALAPFALAPALLVVPTLVSRWLSSDRRLGGWVLAGLGAAVGAIALLEATHSGGPVTMPLGHHLLLAPVLVVLWPIGWEASRGSSLVVRMLVVAPTLAAVLGTRSLVALAAVMVQVVMVARPGRRVITAGVALALGGVLGGARLLEVVAGADSSTSARLGYARAGWEAFLESPWWGWGPGSTGWTVGRWWPGAPGELVGDLHSLVLTVLFETGLLGVLASVVLVAVVVRQLRDSRLEAGAPLLGIALCLVAGPTLGTVAPWVALAVAIGWALAPPDTGDSSRFGFVLGLVVALALVAAQVRPLLARSAWDRAAVAEASAARLESLHRAVALDSGLPLYRWKLALVEGDVTEAAAAARRAPGVAALALGAGSLAAAEPVGPRRALARAELERAYRLDPGDAFAAFSWALTLPDGAAAIEPLRDAIVGEPRLLAAPSLALLPEARREVLRSLLADEQLDPGWRASLFEVAPYLEPTVADGDLRRLVDSEPATSLSLIVFRRRPLPTELVAVPIDLEVAQRLEELAEASRFEDPDGEGL